METLATEVDSTWKLRPIDGSATLTIVASMIVMNIAATYTTLTATFWLTRLVIPILPRQDSAQERRCNGPDKAPARIPAPTRLLPVPRFPTQVKPATTGFLPHPRGDPAGSAEHPAAPSCRQYRGVPPMAHGQLGEEVLAGGVATLRALSAALDEVQAGPEASESTGRSRALSDCARSQQRPERSRPRPSSAASDR